MEEANKAGLPVDKMKDIAIQRLTEGKLNSEYSSREMYNFTVYLEQTTSRWLRKLRYCAKGHTHVRTIQSLIESAVETSTYSSKTLNSESVNEHDAVIMHHITTKFFRMKGKDYCKKIVLGQDTRKASANGVSLRSVLKVTSSSEKKK